MALKMTGKPKTLVDYSGVLGENLKVKPVTGSVSVEKGTQLLHSGTEVLHRGVYMTPSSLTLAIEGGRTINLGNYESARIGVTITMPCEKESLEEAYSWATDWISTKMEEAVNVAKGVQ
jgi:hypothetical protein